MIRALGRLWEDDGQDRELKRGAILRISSRPGEGRNEHNECDSDSTQ